MNLLAETLSYQRYSEQPGTARKQAGLGLDYAYNDTYAGNDAREDTKEYN